MYNASATPMTAKSGSEDPFAIPEDTTKTEKPVVLNIAGGTGESGSEDLVKYVRGKTPTSGSAATANANVIGGRNTYVDTEDSDVLSTSAAAFHDFLRYASVAFAGISVALLLFFHFVSLDANLVWVNAAWSPNTWEFLFYVGYLQQMQATSELTVLKTPYFLWDYTDSFAWSNFLIQDSSSDSTGARRLETIVLGGVVSYADRIGISEASILNQGATGFAMIMGILIIVFLVLAMLAKRKAEHALDEHSDLSSYTSGVHRLRSVSIRALGLCVLVWYFSLYPLSMLASFEISMEIQASTMADALVVAIIALVLVCFGVLAVAGRVIMHKTKDELEQFENLATWGSLYCEYTYRSRMFFVIDVVVQIATGVLVGCAVSRVRVCYVSVRGPIGAPHYVRAGPAQDPELWPGLRVPELEHDVGHWAHPRGPGVHWHQLDRDPGLVRAPAHRLQHVHPRVDGAFERRLAPQQLGDQVRPADGHGVGPAQPVGERLHADAARELGGQLDAAVLPERVVVVRTALAGAVVRLGGPVQAANVSLLKEGQRQS
ncbi:hypothetical protein ON010_g15844 [Phytophthora cinnamomi]|nr:hypothetical protein ON010_g15844 [Phytophthora cinnamomi]